MTRPVTSSRVLLVAERRGARKAPAPVVPVRRYRLARLRLEGQPAEAEGRAEHRKRVRD